MPTNKRPVYNSFLWVIKSGKTQRSGALFCSNIVAALPRFDGVLDGVFGVFLGVTAPLHGRALFRGVFGVCSSSLVSFSSDSSSPLSPVLHKGVRIKLL